MSVGSARGPSDRGQKVALGVLMLAAFVESMGSFLILALIPFYGQEFGASAQQVGWLVGTFALAQLVSAPLWGRLSDRIGRKPVLVLGLVLALVAYLAFAFAGDLLQLFVSRALQGLAAGTVSAVFAYLGDLLPAERRAEGVGWVTAATSGAATVGPLLGSVAARFDPTYPGLWSAALTAVALLALVALLPRTEEAEESEESEEGELEPHRGAPSLPSEQSLMRALGAVVRRPLADGPILVWTYAVGMLATGATFGVIGLFLEDRFDIDATSIWWFFTLLAGVSMVFRIWVLGPTVRRFGERRLILVGMLFLGLATVTMPLPNQTWMLALPIVAFAVGQSLLYPCVTAALSNVAQAHRAGLLGQAMGVQQAYGGVSRVLGPVVGGILFAQIGGFAPFFVAGALALVWASVLFARLR